MTFITQNLIACNLRDSRRVSFRLQNRSFKKEKVKENTRPFCYILALAKCHLKVLSFYYFFFNNVNVPINPLTAE